MLRAVYVRTLKEGVSDEDYIAAWTPEGSSTAEYPARVHISHSNVNERQTVTILEFEGDPENPLEALEQLVHPDWVDRVAAVVESTELELITEATTDFGTAGSPAP